MMKTFIFMPMNEPLPKPSFSLPLGRSALQAMAYTVLLLIGLCVLLFGVQKYAAWKQPAQKTSASAFRGYVYPADYTLPAGEYYTYIIDTPASLGIRDAVRLQEQHRFSRWPKPTVPFNLGMNSQVVWFYLPVKNESPRDLCLVWHLPNTLDTAQLFWKTGDSLRQHPLVSFFAPLAARALPIRALFDTIWLRPGEQRDLYLRLWKNHYNTYVPMSVLPLPELMAEEGRLSNAYTGFIAVFLFIVLFNLFLFASLRDPIHLWYSFFIISISMMLLLDAFYDVFLFPPFFHRLFAITETVPFVNFLLVGTGRTMQLLLEQNKTNSRFYRPLLAMFGVDVCWGFMQLSLCAYSLLNATVYPYYWLHTISDVLMWFTAFLIASSILEKIINRHPLAIIYLFTSLLPMLGILNYYLSSLGLAGVKFLYPNSVAVGVALEITLLTFLLTQRYNQLKNEKNKLLQQQLVLQKEMSERIAEVQEIEQKRIASDLHDGLGSFLTALRMMVNKNVHYFANKNEPEPAQSFLYLQQQMDKAVDEVRTISHNLMPKDFEQNELTQTIIEHLAAIGTGTQIHVEYYLDPQINNLPKDVQITLYRICTELVSNTVKHAQCEHVTVQFIMDKTSLQLMVEDDGKGFKESEAMLGLGLKNIRSRVAYLSGTLSIDSGPTGSTFVIEIPLNV